MNSKFLAILLSASITTVLLAADMTINSSPEGADVIVRATSEANGTTIGKTPLKVGISDLTSTYAKSPNFLMELVKEGYDPYRMMVSNVDNFDVTLNVTLDVSKNVALAKRFDKVLNALFEAQRLIRIKAYKNALGILEVQEKDNPDFSLIYELKGSALYLQKDFVGALAAYRKAFSINAENSDAYAMMRYLEANLGVEKK